MHPSVRPSIRLTFRPSVRPSVDLSKAFDVVDHHRLLWKINNTDLNPNLKRWLVAYLRDRRIRVLYQGSASRWRKVKYGVPQGRVLSPLLWNFFMNDVASVAEIDESYADDLHAAESDPNKNVIAAGLSVAARGLSDQAVERGLSLSTMTLFTLWNREFGYLPPVSLDGAVIPQVDNPKLLGVTLDPSFTFSNHAQAMARKANSRIGITRALADSTFGHDKE